jgi:hypothetical protein
VYKNLNFVVLEYFPIDHPYAPVLELMYFRLKNIRPGLVATSDKPIANDRSNH